MSTSASPSSFTSLGNNGPRYTTADWTKLLDDPVNEDDEIWTEYIKEAAKVDERMIVQWNNLIDGVLVYVALFLTVLAALIVMTVPQFDRAPAEISNELLLAIYNTQKNSSLDTFSRAYFFEQNHEDHRRAVVYNALLYADLALSIVVSMIALFAKIWVINYRNQVNSFGSPYKRAMERQEAYNGVVAWRMIQIIDSLPFLLLIAVFMLGVYVYLSIRSEQGTIGYVIGAMLLLGFVFLILASVAAAFIPACPFKSSLTTLIKLFFNLLKLFLDRYLSWWIPVVKKYYRSPWGRHIYGVVQHDGQSEEVIKLQTTLESSDPQDHAHQSGQDQQTQHPLLRLFSTVVVSGIVVLVLVLCILKFNSGAYYALICLPFAAGLSIFWDLPRSYERPPKYGLEYWILLASIVIAPFMIAASYFSDTHREKFMGLFFTGCALHLLFTVFGAQLFTFTPETRETDAVAWLLASTASQKPEHFKKAGKISMEPKYKHPLYRYPKDSNYDHRKASMLTSLLPLLSFLITSKIQSRNSHQEGTKDQVLPEKETKDLEIYVACLAQLSDFQNVKGSIWRNQLAVIHPSLSDSNTTSLVDALEEISKWEGKFNLHLSSAARDALKYYKVGKKAEGKESV